MSETKSKYLFISDSYNDNINEILLKKENSV